MLVGTATIEDVWGATIMEILGQRVLRVLGVLGGGKFLVEHARGLLAATIMDVWGATVMEGLGQRFESLGVFGGRWQILCRASKRTACNTSSSFNSPISGA